MEKLFQDLERLLEIEKQMAEYEAFCHGLEADVEYEKGELKYAKIQLLSLESPDFFLRLMPSRLEKKKEQAQAQVHSHSAALENAKRDLEAKRFALESLNQEYQSLLPRREEYAAGQGIYPAELEQHLIWVEGVYLAENTLLYLGEAGKYLRGETARGNDTDGDTTQGQFLRGSRKLEYLAEAAQNAKKLREVLDRLSVPIRLKGSYLSWPDHYITEPTSVYAKMDRLNMAVDTLRDVRNQLRERL